MFIRVGQHSVTMEKMWSMYEDQASWAPGIEWTWADYEVSEDSRHALLLYSNPVDRYWEFFHLPGDEIKLHSRWDRVQDRADDEYVGVWHVRQAE